MEKAKVYFTSKIDGESLVRLYDVLGGGGKVRR